jgi:hypothetical protein
MLMDPSDDITTFCTVFCLFFHPISDPNFAHTRPGLLYERFKVLSPRFILRYIHESY